MNPFISFCLYVAARVFVQYLKSKPDDSAIVDSLRFLLSAMNALKRKNPLTESFLVQLDVDIEVLGSRVPKLKHAFPRNTDFVSIAPPAPAPMGLAPDNIPQAHPLKYSAEFQAVNSDPSSADFANRGCGQKSVNESLAKKPYKNDCFFSRASGDNGNAAEGPNIADPDASPGGLSSGSSPSDQRATQWNSGQQGATTLPVRQYDGRGTTPFTASMHGVLPRAADGYGMDATGTSQSMSGSSGENTSGLTPGSSSASDIRQNLGIPHHPGNSSGQTSSYGASPQPQSEQMTAAFFEMTTQYTVPQEGRTGLTPQFTMDDVNVGGNGFAAQGAASWGDGGGTGMTPVPEMTDGVLRNIMGMGPMDAMDLTVWDTEINITG